MGSFFLVFSLSFSLTGCRCLDFWLGLVPFMKFFFAFLVVLAGIGTVIQTGMNMQLRLSLGHGILAALTNFCVGFFALAAAIVICRIPLPALSAIGQAPAWAWFGGLFGAFFIGTLAIAGRELGGVFMVALIVTGQLFAALLFDHYGWLGFPIRPLSISRIIGSILLVTSPILFKES